MSTDSPVRSATDHRLSLFAHFVMRDLKQRYLGSLSGGLWALLQPLILLGVYSLVFVEILKVRLPAGVQGDIVPFLVAGLWPWTAFAESLNRSVTAYPDNAGLLAKVALPRELLVLSPVTSTFTLHLTGFIAVSVLLFLIGKPVSLLGLVPALVAWMLLYLTAVGLALAFASIQVFVRDLSQVLGQLLTLWFFVTPVFYSREMVPPGFAKWLALNPITSYLELVRGPLVGSYAAYAHDLGLAAIATVVALTMGIVIFRRLARHFEDFL